MPRKRKQESLAEESSPVVKRPRGRPRKETSKTRIKGSTTSQSKRSTKSTKHTRRTPKQTNYELPKESKFIPVANFIHTDPQDQQKSEISITCLDRNSEEWKNVYSLLSDVFPDQEGVLKIEKVVHPQLLKRYLNYTEELAKRIPEKDQPRMQQMLWHGTRHHDPYRVAKVGLDVRVGRRGRIFGAGSFRYSYMLFASHSAQPFQEGFGRSEKSSPRRKLRYAAVLLCRFATGRSEAGWYLRNPSKMTDDSNIPDSGSVEVVGDKSLFSVFESRQVYVNYIVSLDTTKHCHSSICLCACHTFVVPKLKGS